MNDNGYKPPIIDELESDAQVLGAFFRALKAQGIPVALSGQIVADLYRRIRYVTPASTEPIE